MRNSRRIFGLLAAGLSIGTVALAAGDAPVRLLVSRSDDLVPQRLVAAQDKETLANTSRDEVSLSWGLTPGKSALAAKGKDLGIQAGKIDLRDRPPVMESREYWFETAGADLNAGVALEVSAPGAVVRVHPIGAVQGGSLDPVALDILNDQGTKFALGSGMDLLVNADQMREAKTLFPEGTAAFRIKEEVGAGRLVLRANGTASAKQHYLVSVLDRQSELLLSIKTGRSAYLDGQALSVQVALHDGKKARQVQNLAGMVTAPNGERFPLRLDPDGKNGYKARLPLKALRAATNGGLWEVQALASGQVRGKTFKRFVKTAFAVALPTARLESAALKEQADGDVKLKLGVEVASAGRYEVRGLLYGTDESGALQPVAVAHSAAWLEAGARKLRLVFDAKTIADSGLKAPFELRDLRLMDQSRVALLHRQAVALQLP